MKNRFTRMFTLFCAAMLMLCAVFAYADAESDPATATDLQESVQPEEGQEGPESIEVLITKALTLNQSWSGVVRNTKPAILKLDIETPQIVYLLAEGKDVWFTVEKSDRTTENPTRIRTDEETCQKIHSWNAEEGSYLITVGPVEPNLMALASISFMSQTAYEEWEQTQTAEPEEKQEAESAGKEISETAEDAEPENKLVAEEAESKGSGEKEVYNETDVKTGNQSEALKTISEDNQEQTEFKVLDTEEEQAAELPEDEILLSMGYYKTQVARAEGSDLFASTEEDEKAAEHLDAGTELWVKPTEETEWAEIYQMDEEAALLLIKWEDLIITLKPEDEQQEEQLPARYIEISSTISEYKYIVLGTDITMTAELFNFRDEDLCEFQWQYYDETKNEYINIDGANEQSYTYQFSLENMLYDWKLVVTILNEDA